MRWRATTFSGFTPRRSNPGTPTRGAYYIKGSARATATGGSYKGRNDYLLVSLPPGFVGLFDGDGLMWLAVHPIDTHRCTVRTGGAFAAPAWTMPFRTRGLPDFMSADKTICERVQRGVSGDFAPGRLVPMERPVADFGHYLNWRLNGIEPPAVHAELSR